MSDFTRIYDGASYDAAESVLSGAVFDTEFDNIQTAVNSKLDKVSTSDLDFTTTAGTYKIVNVSASVDQCSLRMTTDGDMGFYDEVDSTYYLRFSQAQNITYAYRDIEFDSSSQEMHIRFRTSSQYSYFYGNTSGNIGLYDSTNGRVVWSYVPATNQLVTNATTLVTGNVSLGGTVSGAGVKDEDNMASNSATALATQQSIKAYVDNSLLNTKHYVGQVSGSGSISASNGGISCAKIGTGSYRLTHNFGDLDYTVHVTVYESFPRTHVSYSTRLTNTCVISFNDETLTAVDRAFDYHVSKF